MKVILSREKLKKHRVSVCVHTRHYFTLISTYMSALYSFSLNMNFFFAPNVKLLRIAQS